MIYYRYCHCDTQSWLSVINSSNAENHRRASVVHPCIPPSRRLCQIYYFYLCFLLVLFFLLIIRYGDSQSLDSLKSISKHPQSPLFTTIFIMMIKSITKLTLALLFVIVSLSSAAPSGLRKRQLLVKQCEDGDTKDFDYRLFPSFEMVGNGNIVCRDNIVQCRPMRNCFCEKGEWVCATYAMPECQNKKAMVGERCKPPWETRKSSIVHSIHKRYIEQLHILAYWLYYFTPTELAYK